MVETSPTRTHSLSARKKAELLRAADTLRRHMDAAEYKHAVLGLIFLEYLSDAFDEHHAELVKLVDEGADPEDPDEYRAEGLDWVPTDARWAGLKDNATSPAMGKLVDDAMLALERENPVLNGVLPREYGRPSLDKVRLGQLITDFSSLQVGGKTAEGRDVLGQIYTFSQGVRERRRQGRRRSLYPIQLGEDAGREVRAVVTLAQTNGERFIGESLTGLRAQ